MKTSSSMKRHYERWRYLFANQHSERLLGEGGGEFHIFGVITNNMF